MKNHQLFLTTLPLINENKKAIQSISLDFIEHGIKKFRTVEGLTVNIDTSTKLQSILGEPLFKLNPINELRETWYYPSKGLSFEIIKETSIINNINIFSSNFYIVVSGSIVYYNTYQYEIGNGWKINDPNSTMDAVVTKLGNPFEKITPSSNNTINLIYYRYLSQYMYISFYSDSENNYTGKTIRSLNLY